MKVVTIYLKRCYLSKYFDLGIRIDENGEIEFIYLTPT